MHFQRRSLAIFVSLVISVYSLHSQFLIKNFTVTPAVNNTQAYISWTVDGSSQACSDLTLMWSTDSFISYQAIHPVPTVCGGSGFDQDYYYQHTTPNVTGKNFYRLYAFSSPVSPIILLDLGALNGAYSIYPQPLSESSVLTFKNPSGEQYILDISNASCTKRYIQTSIIAEQIPLQSSWFDQGIYFFRLYNESGTELIKGKFIVVK